MNETLLLELTMFSTIQAAWTLLAIMLLHRKLTLANPIAAIGGFAAILLPSVLTHYLFAGAFPSLQAVVLALLFMLMVLVAEPGWRGFGHALLAAVSLAALSYATSLMQAFMFHISDPLLNMLIVAVITLFTFAGLIHLVGSTFELSDVLFRSRWERRTEPLPKSVYAPFVSIHVPAYAEPPQMVKETLDRLKRLDYPNFEVIIIDDNTPDERLWKPVQQAAQKMGFKFRHVMDRPGFKAGALNEALALTDRRAELIAVVDSDYQVQPDFLHSVVGYFKDPQIAFVQTSQDYREYDRKNPFEIGLYLGYEFFFKICMRSRNERNSIIFAGTMGVIRKKALTDIGGWNEQCVTEDAELSLRLLNQGWKSYYIDKTLGRGLMPTNLGAYKKQFYRWCIGGIQILKDNIAVLLPLGRGSLTYKQRVEYLYGFWGWTGSVVTTFFALLAIVGGIAALLHRKAFLYNLDSAMLLIAIAFLIIYQTRFLWSFRQVMGCSAKEAIDGCVACNTVTLPIASACLKGLLTRKAYFNRTPKKASAKASFLSHARIELAIAIVTVGLAIMLLITSPMYTFDRLLVFLLLWNGLFIFAPTVLFSYWGMKSEQSKSRNAQGPE